MTYPAEDLRNLLSVAKKLRCLAQETSDIADHDLYIAAAQALQARAQWQATHLPDDHYDGPATGPLHRPVDLLV